MANRNNIIKEGLILRKIIMTCPEDGRFKVFIEELNETREFERVR